MQGSIQSALRLAQATFSDAVRRPAFLVGAFALGALLAVLPRLGSPAAGLRDNAALAVELWISTLAVAGPVVAGILGVQATQPDHDAGLSQELLATPRGPGTYVAGRWLGVGVAAWTFCAGSAAVGALGWLGRPGPDLPTDAALWCAVLAGVPSAILLGAGLGFVYGVVASRELAVVCLALHVAGIRLATSWAADAAPAARAVLRFIPDPSRLDCAAEFAFRRPIGGTAVGLAMAATGLHLAAMMVLVPGLLLGKIRRERP